MNVKNVHLKGQDGESYFFLVRIDDYSYKVTVPKEYYQQLTGGKVAPEELVRKSFEFLLEREPASAILPEFELSLISHYFPEYEETVQALLT